MNSSSHLFFLLSICICFINSCAPAIHRVAPTHKGTILYGKEPVEGAVVFRTVLRSCDDLHGTIFQCNTEQKTLSNQNGKFILPRKWQFQFISWPEGILSITLLDEPSHFKIKYKDNLYLGFISAEDKDNLVCQLQGASVFEEQSFVKLKDAICQEIK